MISCPHQLSRRQIIAGGLALGALAGTPALGVVPAITAPFVAPARIVDTHHHFYPPAYVTRYRNEILAVGPGFPTVLEWTPQQSLAAMDLAGVAKAIVSISAPGVWFKDATAARSVARNCNDYAADLVKAYPGRFGFFAALPLPDQAGSIAELRHAMDHLGADGIGLLTSYGGDYLGSAKFEAVMSELDRRSALVYVHPTGADCCQNIASGVLEAALEFPFDTTRTIASLVSEGVFARHPNIRFIFSHGGGTLPFLIGRLASTLRARPQMVSLYPEGIEAVLSRHHYDTVSITAKSSVAALKQFAPISQLLFGTDFPYNSIAKQLAALSGFGLSQAELGLVAGANADKMLAR